MNDLVTQMDIYVKRNRLMITMSERMKGFQKTVLHVGVCKR